MTADNGTNDIPVFRIAALSQGESCDDIQLLACKHMVSSRPRVAHRTSFYALVTILRGEGFLRCDHEAEQEVRAGDILYLKPGPVFEFGPYPGTEWEELHCCVAGERIQTWFDRRWIPQACHLALTPCGKPDQTLSPGQ